MACFLDTKFEASPVSYFFFLLATILSVKFKNSLQIH